jgi:hypothetical protein
MALLVYVNHFVRGANFSSIATFQETFTRAIGKVDFTSDKEEDVNLATLFFLIEIDIIVKTPIYGGILDIFL